MSQNQDEDCLLHMENKTNWEIAYSQHKKYLISLVFRMTGSLSETEEIVQDATHIGTVTADRKINVQINGESVIEDEIEQLNKLWKEAIPQLLKSKA